MAVRYCVLGICGLLPRFGVTALVVQLGVDAASGEGGAPLLDAAAVGYRVRQERLEQLAWPVLDQAPHTEPQAIVLLGGVRELSFSYLHEGKWHSVWPLADTDAAHPAAVQITLRLSNGERYQRLFALP